MIRIATDVGGTFTDYAAFDDKSGKLTISKSSTSLDIIEGVVECFAKAGIPAEHAEHFVHGNTVAINTVIERTGAKTGLLATRGFRDVLELARGNIRNSFDLMFLTPEPLVPRYLRLEVEERMLPDGNVMRQLDLAQAREVIQELFDEGVESVAVCLLHSYANPEHEQALKRLIGERNAAVFATASSDILRQYREFERTSTSVLNAYVQPRVATFLDRLEGFLTERKFRGTAMVMQSNGGTMTLETAKRLPVRSMESGPVGGTIAAAYVGKTAGYDNVVAFDMGGTTAKVSIVKRGKMEISEGYHIGGYEMGYPMQLPVVDILEVGAGGGSIARFDETGALKVGPASAGAVPGPACYGKGGTQPTVTDADVVMGRLNPEYFLGGEIALDVGLARAAVDQVIGRTLDLDPARAAFGIAKLADTAMAHAVRIMTVQKGHDPREFVFVAYGGAGPNHAVTVARELGIRTVVVPPHPGIFSAVGMLLADARDEYVLSYVRAFDKLNPQEVEERFAAMDAEGRGVMRRSGFAEGDVVSSRSVEMRYLGQEFTLVVDLPGSDFDRGTLESLKTSFDTLHEVRYGHAFANGMPEIVSLRLHVCGLLPKPDLTLAHFVPERGSATPVGSRPVYFEAQGFVDCNIYRRDRLGTDTEIEGPAVIEEVMSTTVVHPGDTCRVDALGSLVIGLRS